jgi:hypothetical protein
MKKRELILGAMALTGTVASMVSMQAAYATISCSAGTSATPMVCTGDTGGYLAEAINFTGSNGVQMGTSDGTTGVNLCGSHISGTSAYGLSTDGGSMETKTGTGTAVGSGGCS